MELSKNIFFNTDKLIQNTDVKISYTGSLFQNESEEVFLHYGFDNEWKDLAEIKMEKTDLGFQAEIKLPEYNTLNFCFRDGNNNWDNNQTKNYSMPISKEEVTVAKVEPTALEVPKLKKSYILAKKIKITFYKIVTFIPKFFNGEFKRKVKEQ